MARAPFQVLVLPYRRRPDGALEYALFQRADSGVWQAIAGGGENLETPEAAAARERLRELNGLLTDPQCRFDAPAV
jgi:dATP pyrophosphohydrolase